MNAKIESLNKIIKALPEYDLEAVNTALDTELHQNDSLIIVLDDDPTGVQTVHGISVYTNWAEQTLDSAIGTEKKSFFLLTNSRGFTTSETEKVHMEIGNRIARLAKAHNRKFILVSRSDSTLRGHYPLETKILYESLRAENFLPDGEIICPFFLEGGRFTVNDIHYVADGDRLIPAGQTEFAQDKTFAYNSSNLRDWIEEKSQGTFKADTVISISIDLIRARDYNRIASLLRKVSGYNKVIVNALSYEDIKVFSTAFLMVLREGKNFIFRSAAAVPKILAGISDKPCLNHDELISSDNTNGGLIIIGSHVNKTTQQLEFLKSSRNDGSIKFIEFNQHLVLNKKVFQKEQERVLEECEKLIGQGQSVAVYTRRERLDLNNESGEAQLRISVQISDAITSIVANLKRRPKYIIAKGGITSSDIGVKALKVQKAMVLGQIIKGVPVWLTGDESKFPGMPYIIFPGNVGGIEALAEAVNILQPVK
jgi:uncharacterized protein YgbK (DUF1537 family)